MYGGLFTFSGAWLRYKMNQKIMNLMNFQQLCSRLVRLVLVTFSVGVVLFSVVEDSSGLLAGQAMAQPSTGIAQPSLGIASLQTSPLLAYSIDYGMDQARGEKTIEYYGEYLRDLIEQTLRNNEDHPDSKSTAKNTYRRESYLNNVLPKQRSTAFSKEDLLKLRSTENPESRLKK